MSLTINVAQYSNPQIPGVFTSLPVTVPGEKIIAFPKLPEPPKHLKILTAKSLNHSEIAKRNPLLKTWEIVVCSITVIGLLVLLGIYLKRKWDHDAMERRLAAVVSSEPTPPPQDLKLQKQTILQDNPYWASIVKDWQGVSIEEEIWILQLFELRQLGISIPHLETLVNNPDKKFILPASDLPRLLASKQEITKALESISTVTLRSISKCPDAIGLLVNLKNFEILNGGMQLIAPPNFTKNTALEMVMLYETLLTESPDVTKLTELKELKLYKNQLTKAPDLSKNPKLETLDLANNFIVGSLDFSKNGLLRDLNLSYNPLCVPPDLSNNPKLGSLFLFECQLTYPDLSNNKKLEFLGIGKNHLTKAQKQELVAMVRSNNPNVHCFV